MKKFVSKILLLIFMFTLVSVPISAATKEPSVSADGAVLMDAQTGEILYSKNMNMSYPPASTTKLMTALLAIERCKLDDIVKVGQVPPLADGSKIYIYEDEELSVQNLLYALLLVSANDCAEALAEHIGGSMDNFAKEMNIRAKELGCLNTNFVNPSGLYDENHKTSAMDLALIMRELTKHPEYTTISSTLSYKIPPTNKCDKERPLSNENRLIQKFSTYYYEGCDAGKTGYTVKSQHSYVASASRNGQRLIVALIHDGNKTFFNDSRNLFDYGFANFNLVKLFSKGDEVSTYVKDELCVPLYAAKDTFYVKATDSTLLPQITLIDDDLSKVPFNKGDVILKANVIFNNKVIESIELTSGIDHTVKTFSTAIIKDTANTLLKTILYILGALFLAVSALLLRKKFKKYLAKKNKKK